jgi:hypothetical protein
MPHLIMGEKKSLHTKLYILMKDDMDMMESNSFLN